MRDDNIISDLIGFYLEISVMLYASENASLQLIINMKSRGIFHR